MAIIKGNKRRVAKTRRNMFRDYSSLYTPSDPWCVKRNSNQKRCVIGLAQRRIVGVRVRVDSDGEYAYLYQEDRELDNAIHTMRKILDEIE